MKCICGEPLKFVDYVIRRGIIDPLYPIMRVGCHNCMTMFYVTCDAENNDETLPEIFEFEHMNQLDWLGVIKRGSYKICCKEEEICVSKEQLPLF